VITAFVAACSPKCLVTNPFSLIVCLGTPISERNQRACSTPVGGRETQHVRVAPLPRSLTNHWCRTTYAWALICSRLPTRGYTRHFRRVGAFFHYGPQLTPRLSRQKLWAAQYFVREVVF
jgi:hypothetical protein